MIEVKATPKFMRLARKTITQETLQKLIDTALYKRGNLWWISIMQQGTRIQESTGTANKTEAKRLHDEMKAKLWRISKLKEKPKKIGTMR